MVMDDVAAAFAAWTNAYREYVQAEQRLAIAENAGKSVGMSPPQALRDEAAARKKEADSLLAAANAALKRSRGLADE